MPRRDLRRALLELRKQSSAEQRQLWDHDIGQQVLAAILQNRPQTLAVYWPIQAEPNLHVYYQQLHEAGVTLALPIVIEKAQPLRFVKWAPGDLMDTDDFGIPFPRQRSCYITPDTLLIPCVGFNPQGYRLGYGGGFYDRTLAIMPQAQSIGIAYQVGACDFEAEAHDRALGMIIYNRN